MDDIFIRNRITELRTQKNISERSMSIELGHSPSYIHMTEFLYICDYFKITPKEFFDDGSCNPYLLNLVLEDMKSLTEDQIKNIHGIIKGLKK